MNSTYYFEKLDFTNLTEVQRKIINIKDKNILILSPCGSGKTEASHSKLLEWNKKSIIVEPQKTLVTSLYDRLNKYHDKLGLNKWTINHSSMQEDRFLQNDFCITTIDQILSGYLGIGKQAFMRGKNILMSNLVFDEVQLFEPNKTLLTTINMLDEIYKLNNRFIIMTATMPEYLITFLKDRYNMGVVICEEEAVKERQVYLNYVNELNFTKINNIQDKQIIICNTQSQQEEIYENIKHKDRCIILNSKLLLTDRKEIEKKLQLYFGKHSKNNDKILISTQVVEAGMDISAKYLYSADCPIDNLIQRSGRCVRWGGDGYILVFNTEDKIYDKEIVENTNNKIKQNQNIKFTWKIQKEWINEILNPYYKKYINEKALKINKRMFKIYDRNKLIRGIENINLIVDNNISIYSFNKESVGIHINNIKKISKTNKLYILKNKELKKVLYNQINIGDTVVIEGNDCIYDKLGFRYKENYKCESFKYINIKNNIKFNDYVYETWLHHSESVEDLLKYKIEQEQFKDWIVKDKENISFYGGLHDIGKLDSEWVRGTPSKIEPLAHFPFKKGILHSKNRNHAYISAYILKPYISNIMFNVILQHHKRFIIDNQQAKGIDVYKIDNTYLKYLRNYGFDKNILNEGKNILISNKDIITPASKEYTDFLYLEGLLMETEIQAINDYIHLKKVV